MADHYVCPFCRLTSWNPHDAAHHYCGACHVTSDYVIEALALAIKVARDKKDPDVRTGLEILECLLNAIVETRIAVPRKGRDHVLVSLPIEIAELALARIQKVIAG